MFLLDYINARKLYFLVGLYFISSVLIVSFFNVDIMFPCLSKLILDTKCWGCGLSTAFGQLLKLDIEEAYRSNPIVFVILPILLWIIIKDYIKFNKVR